MLWDADLFIYLIILTFFLMDSLVEELAQSAVVAISNEPKCDIGLILCNGNLESMDRLYREFRKKINNNSKKFSLERLDKNYNKEGVLEEKRNNPNKRFVFYDPNSEVYRRDKDIVSRCFVIDIKGCIKTFKQEI
jgi:hypothetical protein